MTHHLIRAMTLIKWCYSKGHIVTFLFMICAIVGMVCAPIAFTFFSFKGIAIVITIALVALYLKPNRPRVI